MTFNKKLDRRTFITASAGLAVPAWACKSAERPVKATGGAPAGVPIERPSDWDVVKFNVARGAAGAIPAAYMAKIKAADGLSKHLGKHLPYVPGGLPKDRAKAGYIALMWGDASRGYAMHPNAPRSSDNPEGHWYNWIRVAIAGQPASEIETKFDGWPRCTEKVKGALVGLKAPDPSEDGGKNSVYLAQLPQGAKQGDTLRIWAHCLTHGEYVDFLKLG